MKNENHNFWRNYWNDPKIIKNENLQKNVGRTKNGQIIDSQIWKNTLAYIKEILEINNKTELLELCCGNGQIIGELASFCKKSVGVDYSDILLNQLNKKYGNQVKTIFDDILNIEFKPNSFDRIILYFSIQHFNENQTVEIIDKSIQWLKKDGKALIGDIPNELLKWNYINKPEYKRDYISRVVNGKPMIGYWYQPSFFEAISYYFDGISIKILNQPAYQINSSYRFDVLIEKKNNE